MNERLRFTTAQAAEYAACHRSTLIRALEAGELHGGQRKAGGRWSIRRECLDAWLDGETCHGRARVVTPVKAYAEGLPTERVEAS
jgi:excisionase family DNA binding protein